MDTKSVGILSTKYKVDTKSKDISCTIYKVDRKSENISCTKYKVDTKSEDILCTKIDDLQVSKCGNRWTHKKWKKKLGTDGRTKMKIVDLQVSKCGNRWTHKKWKKKIGNRRTHKNLGTVGRTKIWEQMDAQNLKIDDWQVDSQMWLCYRDYYI